MSVVIKETPREITLSCTACGEKKQKPIILIGNSWSGVFMKDSSLFNEDCAICAAIENDAE